MFENRLSKISLACRRFNVTPYKLLSIISPAYNEGDSLPQLIQEIAAVIPMLKIHCQKVELIIADDGSTDNTAQVVDNGPDFIRRLALKHRGISAALYDGVMAAKGEVIATLDADLQNDPMDLPDMLQILSDLKADMVCGIRYRRQDTLTKRLASRASNQVRRVVMADTIMDAGCTLRVFTAYSRDHCFWPVHGGHRFVASFAQRQGLRVVQVNVNHRKRKYGKSYFGLSDRLPKVLWDLVGARWLMSRVFKPNNSGEISLNKEDNENKSQIRPPKQSLNSQD